MHITSTIFVLYLASAYVLDGFHCTNQTNFRFSQSAEEVVKEQRDFELDGLNDPNLNSHASLLSSFLSMIQAQEDKIFPRFHSDNRYNEANDEKKMEEKTLRINRVSSNEFVDVSISSSSYRSNPTVEVLSTSSVRSNRTIENKLGVSSSSEVLDANLSAVRNNSNGTTMSADKGLLKSIHRRFLSNVHSSLKHHIKKAEDWAMSKKEVGELFEIYYICLQDKLAALKSEEFPIKTVMAIEGEKVAMDCKVWYIFLLLLCN